MKCRYCDVLLSESEVKMNDPRTNEQRGCNSCWDSIQSTLDEFALEDDPVEIEIVSLDELEIVEKEKDGGDQDV